MFFVFLFLILSCSKETLPTFTKKEVKLLIKLPTEFSENEHIKKELFKRFHLLELHVDELYFSYEKLTGISLELACENKVKKIKAVMWDREKSSIPRKFPCALGEVEWNCMNSNTSITLPLKLEVSTEEYN